MKFPKFKGKKSNRLSDDSMKNGVGLITITKPSSNISEQFRTIRTNIQFSSVDRSIKSIIFTSSGPSEGKSTVTANMAVTFANQGQNVLLVDADLRRPTVHQTFEIPNSQGLTTLLTQERTELSQVIKITGVDNLSVLPSGPIPPNPSELLNTKKMDDLISFLSSQYDVVLFDAPPVVSVTDSQILASKVDGTIVVIPQGIAQKAAVIHTKELLNMVHANIIGAIMNRVTNARRSGYYGYYGYYGANDKDR